MRLLNVWTLELEEFNTRERPSYAILSHTWGEGEVLLQDIGTDRARSLKAYPKILGCCEQAKKDGFQYVWIDTCCIDKTSSSELTEAINSMFTWYRKSVVCYAYLDDLDSMAVRDNAYLIYESRWFTRGWTLQELIAPSIVVFYAAGWHEIGTRDAMVSEISAATGINVSLFLYGKLSKYSVAQRMSWAANRQTTRIEDEAYCLLGLFGVNMPLLYGEGKMAFIRLQEEIMRRSDDQSIFAWRMSGTSMSGLLAPSVRCFAEAGEIVRADILAYHQPFFLTNKGIRLTIPILGIGQSHLPPFEPMFSEGTGPKIVVTPPDALIAVLNCKTRSGKSVALAIDRLGSEDNVPYHRINADLGPVYLTTEDSLNQAHLFTILIQTHDTLNDFSLWGTLRPTFYGIRYHSRPGLNFELAAIFGSAVMEPSNMISAKLSNGGRGGIVFSDGEFAFGVFLGETQFESCWELATGYRADVLALGQAFRNKDDRLLSSHATWRLPLGGAKGTSSFEVSMETSRRPHGYFATIKVERKTGGNCSEPAPETYDDLERRKAKEPEWTSRGIGSKKQWSKAADLRNLSTNQTHDRILRQDQESTQDGIYIASLTDGRPPFV